MDRDLSQIVGLSFEPFHVTIERGKIREFALAIGDSNPLYYDLDAAREAGFRDLPIPPTFPTVLEMWAGADFQELIRTLEMNPLKVLHGEQEYEYLKDICAGDELTGKTTVVNAFSKKGMNMVRLETVYKNREGELVLIAQSLVIEQSGRKI